MRHRSVATGPLPFGSAAAQGEVGKRFMSRQRDLLLLHGMEDSPEAAVAGLRSALISQICF